MKSQPFNLILLGDPAAGKATQAVRIARKYRMFDLDMGRELQRPEIKKKFDYAHLNAKGKLTPTKIVRDIFRDTIGKIPPSRGIIFDGTPKMVGEARLVAAELKRKKCKDPFVIYLFIPVAETVRRMVGRGREDDTQMALRNRIAYYRTDVVKTVAFFKTVYSFRKVSGLGTPKEVAARIEREIEKFRKIKK